jgi:hypothetical protein
LNLIFSGVYVYAMDFGKNEVALARYLRGVGLQSFATYLRNPVAWNLR